MRRRQYGGRPIETCASTVCRSTPVSVIEDVGDVVCTVMILRPTQFFQANLRIAGECSLGMHDDLLELLLRFFVWQTTNLGRVPKHHMHVHTVVSGTIGIEAHIVPVPAVTK